jgi:tetratricopeptide (TPR) repeat protein
VSARNITLDRALTLHRQGQLSEAERLYTQLLEQDRTDFDALHMLGVLAGQTARSEQAVELLREAVAKRCDIAAAHNNLARALAGLDRLEEAVASYDRVIALTPGQTEAYIAKAKALYALRRPQDALATLERAIALDPRDGNLYWKASLCFLLMGRYRMGWKLYESRTVIFSSTGTNGLNRSSRVRSDRLWNGRDDLSGKTVFIQAEQGFGDILQFSRYLRLLEARGAKVIFSVPPPLRRLLRGISPTIEVIGEIEPRPEADYDCLLLSLPYLFSTEVDTIPGAVPYLLAEPELTTRWRERIGSAGFRVGICWQGKPGRADAGRSFPLSSLAVLSSVPGVRLICLQKGAGREQLREPVPGLQVEELGEDFDAGPDAFVDTAAVMQSLDLIISTDSAVAHLAGSLARPAWVALRFAPDWRWFLDRDDSPWYPTFRLFRQRSAHDWNGVFTAMRSALIDLL